MKKILLTLLVLITLSCTNGTNTTGNTNTQTTEESNPEPTQPARIKVIESNNDVSLLSIVEVDGKEYLVNHHGGIIELKK